MSEREVIEDVNIVDMYQVHGTEETKDKYQIFHTANDVKILESMILTKDLLKELARQIPEVLKEE